MESDLSNLLVTYFPSYDDACRNYLINMVLLLKDNYIELKNAMLNYIKHSFPRYSNSDLEIFFDSVCKIYSIEKSAALYIDKDKKFESPICIKDIISTNQSMSKLSSNKTSRNKIVDKKKLELENKKIQEKNEKRQLAGSNTVGIHEVPELSVTQQLNKRQIKGTTADIKIENFNLCFGSRCLLSNANITLSNGRIYGLLGRNGYGKTTLLNALSNRTLELPLNITMYHVKQEVNGDDTLVIDSVVSSDAHRSQLLMSTNELEKMLEECKLSEDEKHEIGKKLNHNYDQLNEMNSENMLPIAATILSGLGFTTAAQSLPTKTFSGGWRMRIALAQALFMKPDLLLLDEPTNMLDLKSLYWLKNYLPDWEGTILIVSHDRLFLDAVCTDIIHLTNQQLVSYRGDYTTFENIYRENILRQKKNYEAQEAHRKHVQTFINRFSAGTRASLAQSRVKALEKLPDLKPPEEEPAVVLKFMEIEEVNKNLIQLDDVSFAYSADKEILNNCFLNVSPRSRVAIVGDNGSGKSTLLKICSGELEPVSGRSIPYSKIRVGYLTQHHLDQLPMNKCSLEILSNSCPGKTELEYRGHLGSFGLSGDLAIRPVCTLSGGQKTRASLAVIAMQRPNLLILDEPTNHLDIETVEALIAALKTFRGAVLLVSHNEYLVRALCTDFYECKNKKLRLIKSGIDEYIEKISQNFGNKLSSM